MADHSGGERRMKVPRRRALRRGAAATLAAARLLAPALFVGCTSGVGPRSRTVSVGMLHSQTGPLAISATGLRDVELHAFEQINAAGGLLGRPVEVRAPDPRSRPELFVKRARQLLDGGAVALFGCWTSLSRKAVLPIVEEARRLLFYSVQYEGNESSPYCVYGGMVPNQQIMPALDWLASKDGGGRRKVFLVGSDYVFPRTANFIARKYLAGKDLKIVGTAYVPLGDRDFGAVVKRIRESGADCILNTVNGDSNLGLFAALADAKVDPAKLPVVSTSIAEDELRSLTPRQVQGHYAVSCYFQSLDTPANREWVAGFRQEFGFDRVTGDPMEPDWCLVHLWKLAVEKAGSFETEAVRQAFRDGLEFAGPGGPVRLDPQTQHTTKFFRLGRIRSDRQFDIVHASPAPLDPDPYPEVAFPGWGVDWTKDGVTRGPEVDIDGPV
jgi:urea transport system substrate-binding protein